MAKQGFLLAKILEAPKIYLVQSNSDERLHTQDRVTR